MIENAVPTQLAKEQREATSDEVVTLQLFTLLQLQQARHREQNNLVSWSIKQLAIASKDAHVD